MFGHYGGYHSPPCVFSMPQQAPESQHSQGYKIQISYACISCAPEKAPEFGTFSTLATPLVGRQETGEKLKNITNPVLTLTVSYVLTVN